MVIVIIECASCPVRELHCQDCMVTALLSPEQSLGVGLPLDRSERAAVNLFVQAGLINRAAAAGLRARSEPVVGGRAVG